MSIKATVKANNALSDIARKLAIPVLRLSESLAAMIFARVERGQGADGPFRKLGADSTPTSDKGLFWVHPKRVQPAGYVSKATTSNLRGWAGYESYAEYVRLLGESARDFRDSGKMMAGRFVKVMGPGRVKISFAGTHGKSEEHTKQAKWEAHKNTEIAFLASRWERHAMLMPTIKELHFVREFVREHMEDLVLSAAAQNQVNQARAATRAANKAAKAAAKLAG